MKEFPQELVDYIIDYFHADKITLLTTSIVCRRWMRESRVHLFRTLRVTPGNTKFSPPDAIYECLLDLLRNCDFQQSIRVLEIDSLAGCGHDPTTPGCELHAPVFLEILTLLPYLFELKLSLIRVDMSTAPLFASLNIPRINLSGVFWHNGVAGLAAFLRQFSHIDYLNMGIHGVYSTTTRRADVHFPAQIDQGRSSIRSLRLPSKTQELSLLCDAVRRSGMARTLKQIWVATEQENDILALQELLWAARTTLEHLEINMTSSLQGSSSGYIDLCRNFELSCCIGLKSVALHMGDYEASQEHSKSICDGIAQLLSAAPRTLQRVIIKLPLSRLTPSLLENLEIMDWMKLSHSLNSLEGLGILTFQFSKNMARFGLLSSPDDLYKRVCDIIVAKLSHCRLIDKTLNSLQFNPPQRGNKFDFPI